VNPLVEFVGTRYPRFYDSYLIELIGTHLGVKTAGRNIIILILVPVLVGLYVLYSLLRCSCKLIFPKKKKVQ